MPTFSPQDSVSFENVYFSYERQIIFEDLTFHLGMNQFAGIIGLNGSGKSTLLKLIMGLLSPQRGAIRILNRKAKDPLLKHYIGSSLQNIDFPDLILPKEILKFVGQQYKKSVDIKQLMKDFFIDDFRNTPCAELSTSTRNRLALACAFVGQPQIVLLNEPSTGLDLNSRQQLIQNIRKYQIKYKALVLLISHHPEEISSTVDQFIHVKPSSIEKVSPKIINQIAELKQIKFNCLQKIDFSFAEKVNYSNGMYQVISNNSDKVVKTLNQQTSEFENLEIQQLATDKMIEGFL